MIDLKKAQSLILEATPVLGRESVSILDALRRVLAQDIVAVEDLPAADISALDGYAVRRFSLRGASERHPVRLRIIGESPAGNPCGAVVGDGEAVRIMTGGVVPEGADTVVKTEDTAEEGGMVICNSAAGCGDGIRFRGESLRKGDVVLCAGEVVGPAQVGALASMRRACVYVHRKPLAAILSTGSELTDFHETVTPWRAMCSNLYSLAAQVVETGAVPLCLGIARDELQEQKAILREALRADIIITSGGTSRGKYDLVRAALADLGVKMRFSTLFAKPGKPTLFGTLGGNLVFGVPGNPSAAMLSFEQFIKPALLKMMGHHDLSCDAQGKLKLKSSGVSDALSSIDSFNEEKGGNREHRRPSQVPLGRCLRGQGGRGRERAAVSDANPDLLKLVAQ